MNFRLPTGALALLLSHPALHPAVPDANLGGSWIMDRDRSFSNAAGLEQVMTVVHDGDRLRMEATLKTPKGEQTVQENWILDGLEREVVPEGAAPGTKVRRKGYWLPGRRSIVLEEERTSDTPKGPVTQKTVRKISLSVDGGTMTMDYYFDTPRGSFESKKVFIRK